MQDLKFIYRSESDHSIIFREFDHICVHETTDTICMRKIPNIDKKLSK